MTASLAVAFVWISNANAICLGKQRRKASAKNSAAASAYCREYKAKNPNGTCIVDRNFCPKRYVAAKKFKGCGINYASCVKGSKISKFKNSLKKGFKNVVKNKVRNKIKDKTAKGRAKAAAWCKIYSRTTGMSCKPVKTGRMCPRGYRRFTKLKGRKFRNYKICIKGRKIGPSKQHVDNNCDPRSASYTKQATDWLTNHYDDVTGNFHVTGRKRKNNRIRRRLSRKFRNVNVVCYPRNTGICAKKGLGGQANAGQLRKVHICFKRHKSFCSLVGTLFHEVAHKARVPHSKIHNNFNNPDRLKDHVYRLGIKARQACVADGADFAL